MILNRQISNLITYTLFHYITKRLIMQEKFSKIALFFSKVGKKAILNNGKMTLKHSKIVCLSHFLIVRKVFG